jgi:D-alanyl-lipoteichoic acid acyltransferase DltB (MBOAT superfamily)
MLFNSLSFAIFLPIVFFLYWFATKGNYKVQNILLLVASYYFYACWDYRFLFLLIFSTFLDYFTGLRIDKAKSKKFKLFWLWLSIVVNLGFLGVFKYYNFFAHSFVEALTQFGLQINPGTINVILPVGISFYTFHGLSYVIDIYKNRIKHEKSFVNYSVFVSFFPLLVAGPIERATHLLPQIVKKREFNYSRAVDGMRQILWGLFKKIVIADNCAEYANLIFNNSANYSGSTLILGAVLFAFQIYCDFSGYSDIALGTARLFGIELLRNFAFPYFSRDIAEFWRRWHISLSSWFRDYVYIPLGGSKGGIWMKIRNTFIIFLLSGFWHGANWTFIVWGALNAIYFLPLLIFSKNRQNLEPVAKGRIFPRLKELFSMIATFGLTVFAWIFFRADSISHAINYIFDLVKGLLSKGNYIQTINFIYWDIGVAIPIIVVIFIFIEWIGREQKHAIESLFLKRNVIFRYLFYYLIIICIFYFSGKEQAFIYFQF